jgi:hypothetical protein
MPSEKADVIDLLLIARLTGMATDMLTGDTVGGQLTGNLLTDTHCLYVEVEAMLWINNCLCHIFVKIYFID